MYRYVKVFNIYIFLVLKKNYSKLFGDKLPITNPSRSKLQFTPQDNLKYRLYKLQQCIFSSKSFDYIDNK